MERRWLAAVLAVAVSLFASALSASPAAAAMSCAFFANGNLEITSDASGDQPGVVRSGDSIVVKNGAADVNCFGSGTVLTVDRVIFTPLNNDFSEFTIFLTGGLFAPGEFDEAGGTDEIEFEMHSGPGGDHLQVFGTSADDSWTVGRAGPVDGMNLNAGAEGLAGDVDVTLEGVDDVDLFTLGGADTVRFDGGGGFTGPPGALIETRTELGLGDDMGVGGPAADLFNGVDGTDRATGGAGDDVFIENASSGEDDYSGGPGTDLVDFQTAQPVRVDLSVLTRQDTGAGGRDVIEGVENALSGTGDDVLIGSSAANELFSLSGADLLQIRDGVTDSVTCGTGTDTVVADLEGVDALMPDCETHTFDTRPDTSFASGPSGPTRDSTPTFAFTSTKPGSSFECSLDAAAFAGCAATLTTARLRDGAHGLRVRARDVFGALDLAPAARAFTVDTRRPAISRATIGKRFRLGRKRTAVKAAGSSFRYRLSEAATVRIKVQRCVRLRGKRCRRYRTLKTLTRKGRKGANRNAFSGRIRGVRARTGLFRATLTATDRAGNRSRVRRLAFRITP